MKRRLKIIPLLTSLFMLPSCGIEVNTSSAGNSVSIPQVDDSGVSVINDSDINIDSAADSAIAQNQYFSSNAITIALADGDSTTSDSNKVSIDNDNNIINIKEIGDYVISGALSNGLLFNTAEATESLDTVRVMMNGVFIRCAGTYTMDVDGEEYTPGPIYSTGTSNLLVNIPENTSSVIVDNRDGRLIGEQNDAAIYAHSKLKFRGKGSLRVNAFANNGIESKKSIEAFGLTLAVLSPGSCLKAKNSIVLGRAEEGGSFTFNSTGEAGHAVEVSDFDESVTIPVFGNTEENDDIAGVEIKDASYSMKVPGSAIYSAGALYMEGGNGQIESKESHALYAEKGIIVDGGSFYLNALKGDGIRSQTSSVFVNGGTYTMDVGNSTWCQGIRADVNLEIRGGYITVSSGHRGFLAQKIATSGGITYVNSSDDGWKADTIHRERTDTMVYIGGGNHYINAEGDGIDSDGYFEMRSGLVIIVASKDNSHSPLECGTYSQITINGGTLIAYGNDGQVQSLYGNQNTVVVKNHQKVNPNNYYVIRAGYSYYGIKITKESAAICASFAEYSNNEYAIILANYIEPEYVIWANVGFYKLKTFGYVKTICNGAFHGTNNQHPEHSSSPWNVPTGWGYGGFWY